SGEVHGGPEVELNIGPVVEALENLRVGRKRRRAADAGEGVDVCRHRGVRRACISIPVDGPYRARKGWKDGGSRERNADGRAKGDLAREHAESGGLAEVCLVETDYGRSRLSHDGNSEQRSGVVERSAGDR